MTSWNQLYEMLSRSGRLSVLAQELSAELTRNLPSPNDGWVRWMAAFLTQATFSGRHLCLDKRLLDAPWLLFEQLETAERKLLQSTLPPEDFEKRLFDELPVARDGSSVLVYEGGRLYFQRFWRYEERLAGALRERLTLQRENAPSLDTVRALHPYWTDASDEEQQLKAVQCACSSALAVVTGGPGTGKTTIVAAILAWFYQQNPDLRMAVCAPTGKAQSRLAESLREESFKLNVPEDIRMRVAKTKAWTLHRLLSSLRMEEEAYLNLDLLVVDEFSMVPAVLADRLFKVLSLRTRLLLLGDRNQLAAVENGSLLADVVEASKQPLSPWRERTVQLTRSRRFAPESAVAKFKEAVNANDWHAVCAILHAKNLAFRWIPPEPDFSLPRTLKHLLFENRAFRSGPWFNNGLPLADAYAAAGAFQILTALREGIYGAEEINLYVKNLIGRRHEAYFKGMPLMVTQNDYRVNLFNGDIGLCWEDESGGAVFFPDLSVPGGFRRIPYSRLPPHETAFAMTVHKSQGSGFGEILLILPSFDTPVLTRELLYTAVTRARENVTLFSAESVLRLAMRRSTNRASGLAGKI